MPLEKDFCFVKRDPMIKSLKIKILLSFTLLIFMLLGAGIMSIFEFSNIGDSVDKVLKNNYQSIESAKKMADALERENNGILLWLIGDRDSGMEAIHHSDSTIRKAISETDSNITEAEEPEYISAIIQAYDLYHTSVLKIVDDGSSLGEGKNRFEMETQTLFFNTKKAINYLMALNQDQMYRQSGIVKEKSRRAMMPAIVSIAAAVIFVLLFNFFIAIYFSHPIKKLINSIKEFYPEKGRLNAHISSQDEFKTLEEEINNLIYRLLKKRDNVTE